MPASVMPMASTTAMQPSGIASMAARVEVGEDQLAGVARSSRAGTKRSVKASPTRRPCPPASGFVPRIQTLRRPFFRRTVVSVAVDTPFSTSRSSAVKVMVPSRIGTGPAGPRGWPCRYCGKRCHAMNVRLRRSASTPRQVGRTIHHRAGRRNPVGAEVAARKQKPTASQAAGAPEAPPVAGCNAALFGRTLQPRQRSRKPRSIDARKPGRARRNPLKDHARLPNSLPLRSRLIAEPGHLTLRILPRRDLGAQDRLILRDFPDGCGS